MSSIKLYCIFAKIIYSKFLYVFNGGSSPIVEIRVNNKNKRNVEAAINFNFKLTFHISSCCFEMCVCLW